MSERPDNMCMWDVQGGMESLKEGEKRQWGDKWYKGVRTYKEGCGDCAFSVVTCPGWCSEDVVYKELDPLHAVLLQVEEAL